MFRHKDTKTLNNSMMIFSVFGGSDKSGVSSISFSCSGCKHWMQKTAGIRGRLVGDKDCDSITVGEHMLEASD